MSRSVLAVTIGVLVLLLGLSSAPRAAHADADPGFTIAPVAAWVIRHAPDLAAPSNATELHGGVDVLLDDQQLRAGATIERYVRRTRRVLTPSAVESQGEIEIPFHPAYEQLVLHGVRILRGGTTTEVLKREDVKILQREAELGAGILSGTATALVILHDLRVGDVIDYELSRVGANPVFGGKLVTALDLAYRVPVRALHRRVVAPAARSIEARTFGRPLPPRIEVEGDVRTWTWELRDVPAIVPEDNLPAGYDPSVWAQLSEFATWKDVLAWAEPMYGAPGALSDALRARVDAIAKASTDDTARLRAALKLVQTEIRYLGLELGESSHRPEAAAKVYERKFGDCKDKAQLLVAILAALGVEARPAFVNTSARGEITGYLPSPLAFDHVIVRVKVGARELWLDGTRSTQAGEVDGREAPSFGRALVVDPASDGLTEIPRTPLATPLVSVEEDYLVERYDAPVTLQVKTIHRGRSAESLRARLAVEPRSETARAYLNFYARTDPDVVEVAAPTFEDDPAANVVTVIERYRFPTFWKKETRWFQPYEAGSVLERPRIVQRTMPLAVEYPHKIEHVTRVTFPGPYVTPHDSRSVIDATIRYFGELDATGNVVTIRHQLETLRDVVPAAEVQEHVKTIGRVEDAMWFGVDQRAQAPPPKDAAAGGSFALFLGTVAVMGIAYAVIRAFALRKPRRRARASLGEEPKTAIVVSSESELNVHLEVARCACGARWSDSPGERLRSEATFEGRPVSAIRIACGACGAWTRRWFRIVGGS